MRIPIEVRADSPEPMYHQIEVQLRALIINGLLPEGTLLPSIRELAQDVACSVITIRRVYQDLENEGLLRTKQGTGTFVSTIPAGDKESYRRSAVTEAFEQAVETGLRVNYSGDELITLFNKVLQDRIAKGAGRGE